MKTVTIVTSDIHDMNQAPLKTGEERYPLVVQTYEDGSISYGRNADAQDFAPSVTCAQGHCSTPYSPASSCYDFCDDCDSSADGYISLYDQAWYGMKPVVGTTSTPQQYTSVFERENVELFG